MLYLIHGNNTYLSNKALHKYLKGEHVTIDGEEVRDVSEITSVAETVSLFAQDNVTIVKRLFRNKKKTVQASLLKWLQTTKSNPEIIFWEEDELSGRAGTVKNTTSLKTYLLQNAKTEVYKTATPMELMNFVKKQFAKEELKISDGDIKMLLARTGCDQNIIENEVLKLALYLKSQNRKEFSQSDLELVTLYEPDHMIWDLTDAISAKNRSKAIKLMEELLENPNDFPILIGATLKHLMQMLLIKKYPYDKFRVSKIGGILPFLYSKTAQGAGNFTLEQLTTLYNKFVMLDKSVKSGLIEVRLGFTLLIITP